MQNIITYSRKEAVSEGTLLTFDLSEPLRHTL